MININSLKENLHFLANKSQTGASITPKDFNSQIPYAVYYVIRRHLGLPEEYNPQMPLTQMGYEKTQIITDNLAELKVSNKRIPVNKDGIGVIPADYLYISDIYSMFGYTAEQQLLSDPNIEAIKPPEVDTECEDKGVVMINPTATLEAESLETAMMRTPIEVVTSDVFTSRHQHSIRVVSLQYPICSFAGQSKLEFRPRNIKNAYITYIQKPKVAYWGYTTNPATLQNEYNPATSVNIDLPEQLTDMVTAALLARLGYNVRETELQQIANKINTTGV